MRAKLVIICKEVEKNNKQQGNITSTDKKLSSILSLIPV